MEDSSRYRVSMDGAWSLADLYDFPHALSQAYSFFYCLDLELQGVDGERINLALEGYPWKGGYSYVNLYTVLQNQVALRHRPRIISIQYASPGWIDLLLALEAMGKVAAAVGGLLAAGSGAVVLYKQLQSTFRDIGKARAQERLSALEMSAAQARAVRELSDELAKLQGYSGFEELVKRTGSVEVAGKIISAQYRRVETIAEYARQRKAFLPPPGGES